jgi:FkbM family methyltransferase
MWAELVPLYERVTLRRSAVEKLSARFWRGVVRGYVRWSPLRRGKWRVMEALSPLYAASEPQIRRLPGGATIQLDLGEHVQRWIYFFGVYEKETVDWFRSNLRPGMVVLDIGANVGQYTLIAARDVGPHGRIHAFEPNPISYRRLASNIEINSFANVSTHALAVSDCAGEVTLYVPDHDNMGEASLQMSQTGQRNITVRSVTIDEWARNADLGATPHIDLIKIDVQGLESAVLRGARQIMLRFRPIIICEFEERWLRDSGTSSVELKRMLSELSYSANRITSSGLSQVATDEVHNFENLVLVPSAVRKA